jgi:hypothetical protein
VVNRLGGTTSIVTESLCIHFAPAPVKRQPLLEINAKSLKRTPAPAYGLVGAVEVSVAGLVAGCKAPRLACFLVA